MKTLVIIIFSILTLASCNKITEPVTTVQIERNCTGTYIKIDDENLRVCNPGKLNSFDDGSFVHVNYEEVDACNINDNYMCMLYYPSHGSVKITAVVK